ncbi:TlpA disulfide reductase family protein [Colwellia psychrerythraea]|uniref:Putative thiol:disulfide interchange protein n=1 Tax=Colwellia psychrerythraea (strain 34H / ATCC BAA-681) TaxID=167879 RepID=Q481P4_COLP3|nr:TlpA disulfide reductase family protein [Colwellia psychrerythraea]AAZ24789.1 putative thiol:disulfide interchange protein [Colwellia psychrerythraea 34H]
MLNRIIILMIAMTSLNINAETVLELGEYPPNYLGRDVNGNDVTLEDNKGKIVVISFWASWCSPCLKELPILEGIQNKVGDDKVKVVAINFKENSKQYRRIKNKLSTLKLTLTHDKRGAIGKKFGVKGIPNLFIVGKDGKLLFHKIGYGASSINKIVKVLNEELAS